MNQGFAPRFARTPFTWLAYGLLAYFAFLQAAWGPIMPFLRQELSLSYGVGGLHATAFAAGMLLSGIASDRLAPRFGRRRLLWAGGGGMACAAILLVGAGQVYVTLAAALIAGICGTSLLIMVQAGLAKQHGPSRTIAIAEANIAASLGYGLVPLAVGGFELLGIGWRAALLLAVIGWLALFTAGRRIAFPVGDDESSAAEHGRLPASFWAAWAALVLAVAAEWSVALWAPDFLIQATNIAPAFASIATTIFAASGIVGRLIVSRLARRYAPPVMLIVSLGVAVLGTTLLWLAPNAYLVLLGLSLTGLGIANAYPLGVAVALQTAGGQVDRASARASSGAAVAILVAPQTLGVAADSVGITSAFGIVAVLAACALALNLLVSRVRS